MHFHSSAGDSSSEGGASRLLFVRPGELAQRVLKSLIAIAIGCIIAFLFRNQLLAWLTYPLPMTALDFGHSHPFTPLGGAEGIVPDPTRPVLAGGFVLSLPVTLYQFWALISSDTKRDEKKHAVPLMPVGFAVFLLGLAVGCVVIPYLMQWFIHR